MTILIAIADLGLGGAQQIVINLSNSLVNKGHRILLFDVFPDLRKEGMIRKLDKQIELISPKYSERPKHLFERIVNSLKYRTGLDKQYLKHKREKQHIKDLQHIIENTTVDIVNSHVFWADEFVLKYLRYLHKNWWVTLHGSYVELSRREDAPYFKKQIKLISERAKGFIYLSKEELDLVTSTANSKKLRKKFIPNGIPLKDFPIKRDVHGSISKILVASRAIIEKGWDEAILAVIELNEKGFPLNLLLAGDGPILEELKNAYKKYDYIHFLGYQENVHELIQESDVVLLPSYYEMFPTILIESIVCGTPVIATDKGETKFIVQGNGRDCGLILSSSIQILKDEIIKGLETYLLNRDLYNLHSANAKLDRDRFNIDRIADIYVELYLTEE
jgi:glycosyltransferase involved in cell wall biosynthesis